MRTKKKKIVSAIAIVLAALMVLGTCSSIFFLNSYAAGTLQQQLDEAKKQKSQAEAALKDAQNKKADANKVKESIAAEIQSVKNDIADIETKINDCVARINQKEADLAVAQQKCDEQYDSFKTRARIMYENGPSSYIEVLFGSESFSDFVSNIEIVKSIMNYDKQVLEERVAAKKVIEDAMAEIEQEKQTQEVYAQTLSVKKATLDTKLSEQKAVVDQYAADEAKYKAELKQQQDEENRIQQQIKQQQQQYNQQKSSGQGTAISLPPVQGNGALAWPVPSCRTINSEFGYRIHPIYGTRKLHGGIDIPAPSGSQVVAAEAGVVTFAGYSSSYGNYITIMHSNGLSTLYAHNSSLQVSAGATVTRGQNIAKSGATGNVTGAHLHFEVFQNGTRVNPRNYL